MSKPGTRFVCCREGKKSLNFSHSDSKAKEKKFVTSKKNSILTATVFVSALGYFVDIYDLLLFGIVRVASLRDIGVAEDKIMEVGVYLMNLQMFGMLLGGIVWGVLGDKKGRVSVLFGSILIYSLANILNGFVESVPAYGLLRFLAGFGLAGELGAAITLVSETLSRENRGWGTTLVASIGILGAVFASILGDLLHWKTCYIVGGVLGLLLLFMRVSIYESGMFKALSEEGVKRGDLRMLFWPWSRGKKYLKSILIGVPIWFVVGILITFSPELALQLNITGPILAGRAILFCYAGLSLGDLISGYLSQVFKTRRKVILGFLLQTFVLMSVILFCQGLSPTAFYGLCFGLGFSIGYWAVFITIAAEQFGTNIRATVTTTVPNFVRGSVVLLTSAFQFLKVPLGLIQSAWLVGAVTLFLAVLSVLTIEETYGKNLDYSERD